MLNLNKKGQSIVEIALIMPIIVMLLTGIIDFGFMFHNYLVMINASREATRIAVIGYSDLEINQRILDLTKTLDSSKLTVQIEPIESQRESGKDVSVTINYQHSFVTPLVGGLIANPFELKSKTIMRVE